MLSQKQVKKKIGIEISDEESKIITDSLNELLEIVISNIEKFPEGKRVIPIQDLNEFVTMIFRNMVNIPKGFRRKTVNRLNRINKRIVHNLVINFTFLKRFIEDPAVAIREFQLEEIK